jgi:hypothetical protein
MDPVAGTGRLPASLLSLNHHVAAYTANLRWNSGMATFRIGRMNPRPAMTLVDEASHIQAEPHMLELLKRVPD